MTYWEDCIEEAFEAAGIKATKEQIDEVISWVESGHEHFSQASGHDCIPDPVKLENEELKKELQKEREKVICKECNGTGNITTHGPYHSSFSNCDKCRGEGRHSL